MATINITLPKSLKSFVDTRVATGHYDSPSELIASLLRAARKQEAEAKLLALVKEAERSGPPTPWTAQDLEGIRRKGLKRLAQEKASHAKNRKAARRRK